MQLEELFDYKNQLMKELCHSKKVIELVTDKKAVSVPDSSLAYSQIFPYEYVPETIDNGQTFICFDVDVQDVTQESNNIYYTLVLYIWIFTHKSKVRMSSGGIRIDELSREIDKILNGSRVYGLNKLKLKSVERFSPITDYQGRVLTYYTKDFNTTAKRTPPAKRKDRS